MLRVNDLTILAARNGPALVREVTFSTAPGTMLAVLGANGAGKSTLLRALAGERGHRTGRVLWKGVEVDGIPLGDLARERAFLDQQSAVPFAFTVREVVMMGRYPHFSAMPSTADERAVDAALERMHLTDLQHRIMPSLSGGERKRAHIARVLAQLDRGGSSASLLLMDEPLNDLDVKHQHTLLAHARNLAEQGHCVLAVLHDVNMAARYAHRVLLMAGGRMLAHGRPSDVFTHDRLEAAYGIRTAVLEHPLTGDPWVHFDGTPGPAPHFDERPMHATTEAVPA